MAITEADRKRMGTQDPTLIAALKEQPFPNLDPDGTGDVLVVRKNRAAHLARLRHRYVIPGPIPAEVSERMHYVQARDGHQIPVRIYTPVQPAVGGGPLVVMMHEGGWMMGDLTDEDLNCRMFARDLGVTCCNVDYRLAPEHKFPTGVNDCYDVLKWCANEAGPDSLALPADPAKGFIVGGASAGGNLAAVMCQIAKDEGLTPPLTGQYLCAPALLHHDVVPEKWQSDYRSREEATDDPVISLKPGSMMPVTEILQPDAKSPRWCPLLYPDFKGLPAAYMQVGGLDPLRDETIIYERVLREEYGVKTKIDLYDGFGHMFFTNWPGLRRSTEFINDTLEGFKWLLNTVHPTDDGGDSNGTA